MFALRARSSHAALVLFAPSIGLLAACKPDSGLTKFNSNPEAQITAPSDGATVLSGTVVTLRGAASDPNHGTTSLTARWFVDDDEACAGAAPAEDGTTTCDVTVPDVTELSVRLEVLDPEGSAGTDAIALVVTPNADPVATIQSPTADGVYYSDQLVTFRGTVSDAEDDAADLTVWWEDGSTRLDAVEAVPTGSGEVLGYGILAEGPHALELHVQDTAGNEAIATVLVDVGPPNSAPDCAITEPTDGGASEEGERVTFEGTATDVDIAANLLSVTWSSDKDGVIGTSTPDSVGEVSFNTSALSLNTHRITMTVTDEVGGSCASAIDWTVGSPPTIDIENPISGDVVNDGDTVTFTARVSDGEDVPGDLWVSWASDVDGVFFEDVADSGGLSETIEGGLSVGEHVVTATVTDTAGLYATARVTLTVNGLPSAPGITLTPASPDTDDDLRVSIATASVDPEGDAVTYAYAWSLDGVSSSASTSATLPASATTRGDNWSVSVTATDGLGTSAAGTASVTIGNTAPVLSSLSLTPDPAYEDDVLTCSAGSTSDADGDTVGLTYEWYVDGIALGQDTDTVEGSFFDRGQDVYCTATPTDGTDDGVTRTSNTVTIGNSEPSVASVSISPSSPTASSTLTCAYAGYEDADGDADASTYSWTVDGVEVGTSRTLSGAFVGGDVVTCTVTPFDGTDTGADVSASVTIANTAPVLASVSLTPDPAYKADTLACTPGSVTDADGTTSFTYSYAWTVDGVTIAAASSTLSGADFDAGNAVACVVTVSDGTASSAAVTSNIVTIANTAPVMAAVSVSPASGQVGDTLSCSASATDADGGVSYSYVWSSGATGASYTIAASDDPGDTLTCTATATDSAGATATGTASATVLNTAPVVATVSVTPSTGRVGDTLVCAATASDADGGTPSISYAWSTGATGASLTLTASEDPGDTLTCTATASDTDGGTATGSASASVLNTEPVLGAVSITPATAYNDELLTCAASATDADGGTPTLSYAWTNTSSGVSLGASPTLSLTSAVAASRDTIACAVTASDADGGTVSGSASVTLDNRAPVVTASLTPTTPTRTSTLSCAGSATDADDDTTSLTFSWTVDGASVTATSTSATLSTLAGVFAAGQLVACTVTVTDGKSGTDSDSGSVTIDNTAPVVSSVTLSPSTVYTNDTLTATVSASDSDGDGLSYTYDWYVDGAPVQSGASDTLSGTAYFDRDEVVYVVASADDGVDTASATSASITVSNTAPTAPVVEITPSDAASGDDLTCSVVTESTDADGDPITYTFAWDVDGVAYTGATDSALDSMVDGADVGGGETWTCEVTASDGNLETLSSSASVETSRSCGEGTIAASQSGVDFVEVCGGSFEMGCTSGAGSCASDETLHSVTLTRNYLVSVTDPHSDDLLRRAY